MLSDSILTDSVEYVDSVMSPVPLSQCSDRKRHLSDSSDISTDNKKRKDGHISEVEEATEVVNTPVSERDNGDLQGAKVSCVSGVNNNSDTCVILKAIQQMELSFNQKLLDIESRITDKILGKVNNELQQMKRKMQIDVSEIDVRVDTAEKKAKFAVERVESVKSEVNEKVDSHLQLLKSEMSQLKKDQEAIRPKHVSRELNIVIRNLPEGQAENIVNKANALLKDGLKLKDIAVSSAVRKESFNRRYPGVVIATCRSADDKKEIMSAKKILKDSRSFRDVYIMQDLSPEQRSQTANLKTIAAAIGGDRLEVRGHRIIQRREGSNRPRGVNSPTRGGSSSSAPADVDNNNDRSRGYASQSRRRNEGPDQQAPGWPRRR